MSNKKRIAKKRDKLRKRVKPHLIIQLSPANEFCDFGDKDVSIIAMARVDEYGKIHYFDLGLAENYNQLK